MANLLSRREQLSLQRNGGHADAPCHSRPVSQSGRTATRTSPMSADAVVFATNGSGGADTKAAAGTAMRDASTCQM